MKARYQFRFYPTDQQQKLLAQLFGCVRVVWNDALAICKQSVSVRGASRREAGERTLQIFIGYQIVRLDKGVR